MGQRWTQIELESGGSGAWKEVVEEAGVATRVEQQVDEKAGPFEVLGVSRGSPRGRRRCAGGRGLKSGMFWHIVAHPVPQLYTH
jgi:hypothetical protein